MSVKVDWRPRAPVSEAGHRVAGSGRIGNGLRLESAALSSRPFAVRRVEGRGLPVCASYRAGFTD